MWILDGRAIDGVGLAWGLFWVPSTSLMRPVSMLICPTSGNHGPHRVCWVCPCVGLPMHSVSNSAMGAEIIPSCGEVWDVVNDHTRASSRGDALASAVLPPAVARWSLRACA